MTTDSIESAQGAPWLLLIHALPPKPDYLRVKIRRRLQKLGAEQLKNSVYVLPNSEEAHEDFQWLAREIASAGGEAMVCEASFVEGITNEQVESLFTGERGQVWVTREGVKVDRISSAWLIRRFIDPDARFKFVARGDRGDRSAEGEIRFDMFGGEYTHEGDDCTFETLLKRFELKDPTLRKIGEIVHDIDCKDDKFERPETGGIKALIGGIVAAHQRDEDRLAKGAELLDELYQSLAPR